MTSQKDITDTHDSEQEIVKSEVRTSWILIIVLVALAFWAGSNHITENVTKVTQINPTKTQVPIDKPEVKKTFSSIKRIEKDGKQTTIFKEVYSTNDPILSIFQWKDYLMIFDFESAKVVAHNMTTGVSKDISKLAFNHERQFGLPRLMWPRVIDDSLYFSYGAYMASYPVFYINYPPVSEPKILIDKFEHAQFATRNDEYYLVGGLGDGCFSRRRFSKFDPKTKQAWPTFTSTEGCGEGSILLDFASDNELVMATRIEDPVKTSQRIWWFLGIYTEVYKIDPKNPAEKKMIIDSATMPKNIKNITFFSDSNKLALIGDDIYVYDINSKKLESIAKKPDTAEINLKFKTLKNNLLCMEYFSDENGKYRKTFEINIETKTPTDRTQSCDSVKTEQFVFEKTPHTVEEQIKLLKLPSNYEIVYN